MLTFERGVKVLQDAGAKVTSQRVAIIQALEGRKDHPSAEGIFNELKPDYRTLSIATVYSTMQILAQGGAIRILTIDDKKVYFDAEITSHAHFMCHKCKRIMNVPIGCREDGAMSVEEVMACRRQLNVPVHESCQCVGNYRNNPEIAQVTNAEILLYGVCAVCANNTASGGEG